MALGGMLVGAGTFSVVLAAGATGSIRGLRRASARPTDWRARPRFGSRRAGRRAGAAKPAPTDLSMKPDARLESVHIEGFRSLQEVTFRPNPGVTVLVGPNGGGKSNLVRFFEMLGAMQRDRRLRPFVGRNGGADAQLFGGRKGTTRMEALIRTTNGEVAGEYAFSFTPDGNDRFRFAEEKFRAVRSDTGDPGPWTDLGSGHREANLPSVATDAEAPADQPTARAIHRVLGDTATYQIHDTSAGSGFHTRCDRDDTLLRRDGGNLASVLHRMEREDPGRYRAICSRIRWVLPDFDEFALAEKNGKVILFWRTRDSGKIVGANLTSDGSLRFFALVTLLKLPRESLPRLILLDEPELGLHPAAMALLAGMIRSLAHHRQIIVATQSPLLVDEFGLDEIVVVELQDGGTKLRSFDGDEYREWLDDGYSTGVLWQKNLLGGYP